MLNVIMKLSLILCACSLFIFSSCIQNKDFHPSNDTSNSGLADNEKFIGSWELKEWTAELQNGGIIYPYGIDAKGIISYDNLGNMAVQVMKNERLKFLSEDPLQAKNDEILNDYNSFIAYSGSFEVDTNSNQIIHHVDLSSFPNWVGQNQIRYYTFKGDSLILSTDFIGESKHKLTWTKTYD